MLREPFGRHLAEGADPLARAALEDGPEQQGDPAGAPRAVPRQPVPAAGRASSRSARRYVVKPIYSREGSNVAIVRGRPDDRRDRRRLHRGSRTSTRSSARSPSFDGRYPVVGSWIVNGYACGIGIREDDGLITRNTSRFLPHLFRKSPPPSRRSMNPKTDDDRETRTEAIDGQQRPALGPLAGSLTIASSDAFAQIRWRSRLTVRPHDPLAGIGRSGVKFGTRFAAKSRGLRRSARSRPAGGAGRTVQAPCNSSSHGVWVDRGECIRGEQP